MPGHAICVVSILLIPVNLFMNTAKDVKGAYLSVCLAT